MTKKLKKLLYEFYIANEVLKMTSAKRAQLDIAEYVELEEEIEADRQRTAELHIKSGAYVCGRYWTNWWGTQKIKKYKLALYKYHTAKEMYYIAMNNVIRELKKSNSKKFDLLDIAIQNEQIQKQRQRLLLENQTTQRDYPFLNFVFDEFFIDDNDLFLQRLEYSLKVDYKP